MRLASIDAGNGPSIGLSVDDDMIVDVGALGSHTPTEMRGLLDLGSDVMVDLCNRARRSIAPLPAAEVRFLPVVPRSDAVWCAALNYPTHVSEGDWQYPDYPAFFLRTPGSLCGHGGSIVAPVVSDRLDFEGELAVVIGAPGRHVPESSAYEIVAGYSCFNDASVRDWQRHTSQITAGKNFSSTGAFGPWLTTPDEVSEIELSELTTRLNGVTMQRATIGEMIFGIPKLISYISAIAQLQPGDVIVTGTPGGVGVRRSPPVFMREGDSVEVEIDRVGLLRNSIAQETTVAGP